MRLPRFTTRCLMALVAVVAFALGGRTMWHRHALFSELAKSHAAAAREERTRADAARRSGEVVEKWGRHVRENPWPKLAQAASSQAERHDELAWQYRRAARYPWLSAPLDPPQ